MTGSKQKGYNRVWWDLAHDDIILPPLKTIPDNKDFVKLDKEGNRKMFIYDLDIGPGLEAIRVPPGQYTVILKADNTVQRTSLTVLKDPNIYSNDLDIKAQYVFGMDLNTQINLCLSLIEKLETKRAQLLKENTTSSIAQEKVIYNIEKQLFDIHLTGSRMDIFRNPAKLLERMLSIRKESQTYGADFPPTTQQKAVFAALKQQLQKVSEEVKKLQL
jgi:hypothetical protein